MNYTSGCGIQPDRSFIHPWSIYGVSCRQYHADNICRQWLHDVTDSSSYGHSWVTACGADGAVLQAQCAACMKHPVCTICFQTNATRQWQTDCVMPRHSIQSKPELVYFEILSAILFTTFWIVLRWLLDFWTMDFRDILYLYFSLHSAYYIHCSIQPLAAILNKPIIIIIIIIIIIFF